MTLRNFSWFFRGKIDKLSADNVSAITRVFQMPTDFL